MDIKVYPGKLKGTVAVPPSKSMAHRALICASLAEGRSKVSGISDSKDMEATIGCMRALGAKIERSEDRRTVVIDGIRRSAAGKDAAGLHKSTDETCVGCEGVGGGEQAAVLDCNESGSTLRFVVPIAAALGAYALFEGRGKLPQRPMTPLADEMKKKGVEFLPDGRDSLPFEIQGQLQPGVYEIPGNISSQYISGLIFALPLLSEDSEIRVKGKLESVGYIALTLRMVRDFGIEIEETADGFKIPGNQAYHAADVTVEGDYSQAAFWLTAAACGSELTVTGLREDSAQGDREAIDILEKFGADVERKFPSVVISAPKRDSSGDAEGIAQPDGRGDADKIMLSGGGASAEIVSSGGGAEGIPASDSGDAELLLTALEADGGDIPDVIPVLSVAAACARGTSRFYNVSRLRIKECDRLSAMADCLARLGAKTQEEEEELIVTGGKLAGGCEVSGYNDHRIVMSMAVAALSCEEPVIIRGAEAISKSYPDFFDEFRRLGGRADVISDR